ncbi:DUF3108 domain-containing protein [Mucilaginibacter boryungensis]|uniref:Uncharacterized protein n=1 Tax=Mucilaginibacter boryungensis TaxID=768480 RepID=A0ABR9XNT7_9SPHI|nr:hypothetical protein [Mucilaginibacter boryungensis]MBE9668740.1 hypothetical protein [Mucilaginibacter boryungensis]
MRNYVYRGMLAIVLLIGTLTANAQKIDTINLKKGHQLNTAYLNPGLKQYLVYFQQPKQTHTLRFWLWLRDIKKDMRDGEAVFNISQHWLGADSASYRTVYSVNKASDFSPVYHAESNGAKTRAYNWYLNKIAGADTIAGNVHKTFKLDFTEPNFNWNLDIETFEMLPLAPGKTFAINFYDAALSPPKYVLYKVTGSEVITLLDNTKVDCWKLYEEGKSPNGSTYSETFWISKKGHEFLKEEDEFNGSYRYKIKMPAMTPNLMVRFK